MTQDAGGKGSGKTTWAIVAGGIVVVGALVIYVLSQPEQTAPDPVSTSESDPQTTAEGGEGTAVAPAPEPAAKGSAARDQTETPSNEEGAVASSEPADAETAETESNDRETADSGAADTGNAEPLAATPDLDAPELDVIRIETDGLATVAGRAEPGSQVQVLVDGNEVHSFEVDQSGQFATLFPIAPDAAPRTLTLRSEQGERSVLSDDFLIAAVPGNEPEPEENDAPPSQDQAGESSTVPEAADTIADATGDTTPEPDTEANTMQAEATEGDTKQPAPAETTESGTAQPEASTDTAEAPPAILRSDEEGVELVQSPQAQPDAEGQGLQLDTIGYTDQGQVDLTGRALPGATVRVYLNNQVLRDLTTDESGRWRGEFAGIDPGTYTLRLDALDEAGDVIDRLETPFRREAPEQLIASDTNVATQAATVRAITVQQGDTLWAISRDRYGDGVFYVKVFDANRASIRDPDLIYPGQIFNLPE
ncbi:MAG: LysM peptidoglycan-binding domain-containing protein [Paracoccaceae bacterium]